MSLRGRTAPWGWLGVIALIALVAAGLALRLRGLAAEGFADDEIHKWLAAQRYLTGDFGGDDLEHPMLMKSLVALAALAARGWGAALAPEALTRLPNAIAGALTVLATALLGRRLLGRAAGLLGAALVAFSTTAIGYHRVAKEDTLLGLLLVLALWCLAEARAAAEDRRARAQARWELLAAASLGAALAAKYFLFYAVIFPCAYLWLRSVSAWRVPFSRWLALTGVALATHLALNWAPLLPGTLRYVLHYVRGDAIGGDRAVSESLLFMGRLYGNMAFQLDALPPWFFAVFAAVKLAPATAVLGFAGLGRALWRRAPGERVLLAWLGIFHLTFLIGGARYGRFFVAALPAFALLAGAAAVELGRWLGARRPAVAWPAPARLGAALLGAAAIAGAELSAALAHAPHQRLYVSELGGGDARVGWFFPHCDYFDAGIREGLAWVARDAPPDAQVASEVEWSVRYYAARLGRGDLRSTPLLPGRACAAAAPCYVLAHEGQVYRHNVPALAWLAGRAPAHVERVRGTEVLRIYRLAPGERPFPPPVPVGPPAPVLGRSGRWPAAAPAGESSGG